MIPHIHRVIAIFILLAIAAGRAFATDVTVQGIVISLPNADATPFSAKHDFNDKAGETLKELEELVAGNKATSVANLSVTTKNGQRALCDSGEGDKLEIEPLVMEDAKMLDITVHFTNQGHRILTAVQMKSGAVKFLGSIKDPKDGTRTNYVFIRAFSYERSRNN